MTAQMSFRRADTPDDELWEQAGAAFRVLMDSDDDRYAREAFLNYGIWQSVHDDVAGTRATFHRALDRAAPEQRYLDALTLAEVMVFLGDLRGAQQLYERALDCESDLDDHTEANAALRRLAAADGDPDALARLTDEDERTGLAARRTDGRTDFVYYCGIRQDGESLAVEGPFLPQEDTSEHRTEQMNGLQSRGCAPVFRIETETIQLAMDLAEERRDATPR
ncbi:hypothetical protein ABH926_003470 [Catenulispora sp. GP43]|uniref:hypothetical protein n=1 Tax=Catenulispora sp. GP43 TaxID=3156263 RepID=UPI00351571E3